MTIYEFINPEDLPKPEDMRTDTEYKTEIVSCEFIDGNLVIKLRYLGKAFVKASHSCLLPVIKDSE